MYVGSECAASEWVRGVCAWCIGAASLSRRVSQAARWPCAGSARPWPRRYHADTTVRRAGATVRNRFRVRLRHNDTHSKQTVLESIQLRI